MKKSTPNKPKKDLVYKKPVLSPLAVETAVGKPPHCRIGNGPQGQCKLGPQAAKCRVGSGG